MFTSRRISTSGTGFQDNRSLNFNSPGDNQLLELGSALSLDTHDGYYSFSWWSRRTSLDHWDRVFHDVDSNDNWFIFHDNNNTIYMEGDTDNKIQVGTLTEQVVNKWYHFAFTTTSEGTGQFYQDGVPLSMTTSGGTLDSAMKPSHFGFSFIGEINDFAIYERELNASEVRTIYNGREPFNHKEGPFAGDLIHWWRMGDGKEQGSGTTIYDEAGSNNATIESEVHIKHSGEVPW